MFQTARATYRLLVREEKSMVMKVHGNVQGRSSGVSFWPFLPLSCARALKLSVNCSRESFALVIIAISSMLCLSFRIPSFEPQNHCHALKSLFTKALIAGDYSYIAFIESSELISITVTVGLVFLAERSYRK